jgi:hypothetical protein
MKSVSRDSTRKVARACAMLQACALAAHAGAASPQAAVVVGPGLPKEGMVLPTQGTAAPVTGNPVAAVWKERHVEFFYMGRTARYSCEGLRDKMRAMLLDLGARRDLSIVAVGCEDDARARVTAAGPHLSITFSAPALPDPAAKPVRTGDLAATDARFVAFRITTDAFRNMGIGDCELVEQFTRQILPKLVTREVHQDITCVPNELSGSHYLLRGEVLRPLPPGESPAPRNSASF